jgi:CheY-like chemotaxis protein
VSGNEDLRVLIVEDGDEYLENLSRYVPGPTYTQAKNGAAALQKLAEDRFDLVYLDMRFDRIPEAELLGDHVAVTREQNGDPARAWRHLKNHQGLYILDALRRSGYADLPVVLAYDFSREQRRLEHLRRTHPRLEWVKDAITPEEIRKLFDKTVAVR